MSALLQYLNTKIIINIQTNQTFVAALIQSLMKLQICDCLSKNPTCSHTIHFIAPAYRAAAWIGYYRLLPGIIGYFPHSFKIHELPGGKMYGNNGTFYGSTKI